MPIFAESKWHAKSTEAVIDELKSGAHGLSEDEVLSRQKTHGFNEIPESAGKHWIWLLLRQFASLLVLILAIAALISGLTGHMVDVYVIAFVVVVNAMIGFVQELRAERAVRSLQRMVTPQAKVIRNGVKKLVPAKELVPGDVIVLEEGDAIPADARLFESKSLRAIEASLTGESVPVEKHCNPLPADTVMADQANMVRKSTFIAGGFGLAVVTGTGMNTAIGAIAASLQGISETRSHFQKKTDVLARQMGLIAIGSAVTLFLIAWLFQDTALEEKLMISIAALVSAIPEGLPAVLSIVLAIGANRMSRKRAIIREFSATETLGAVTTIITDKTGTLTQNTLTVRKIFVAGHDEWSVTGEGWSPVGNLMNAEVVVDPMIEPSLQHLLEICGWCNNADIVHDEESGAYSLIGDPTEGALLALARKSAIHSKNDKHIVKIDDLPFNSTLKMRATLVQLGNQRKIFVVGAPEQVLERSTRVWHGRQVMAMQEQEKIDVRSMIESWSDRAMRVIALASVDVDSSTDTISEDLLNGLTFAGITGMIDPPRPDVKGAVEQCHRAGIRVIMATGDHVNTAIAVARATGILQKASENETIALTEKQLLELDEREFEEAVSKIRVFARLTPNMKLRIAETLQRKGELIAMTGDGVNDAPALKKADVGVAMGIMGTDVARDSAKVVLADDNFSTIVSAVEQGRIVFNNTRYTSFFLLTTNFAEIATLLSAVAVGLPMPLTATQILWLNLVTDGACTSAMATESGHGDELDEPPVNPNEPILSKEVLPFIIINAVLMASLSLAAFNWFYDGSAASLDKSRSAVFIVMAFCQLFNVFNMRAIKRSIFKIGMFSNKIINIALVASITIQILLIEVPALRSILHFDYVPVDEFLILALVSSSVLWVGELYKAIRYRRVS
jgi:P-type Ca2+ transporter type 2C